MATSERGEGLAPSHTRTHIHTGVQWLCSGEGQAGSQDRAGEAEGISAAL